MKILTGEQLAEFLAQEPQWSLAGGMIVREWEFSTFPEAIAFVDRIAVLAEARDHHPDIDIRYKRVRLALVTHAANGITTRDTEFARSVRALQV
ncbi:4a-hydroxytetrahydrobiopterin dehydratase [Granulicella rosea]|nr:4a-hydroxytetrahydrobiopterin dehydratase [Granulicella rosea]